jgi:hypothetical protein
MFYAYVDKAPITRSVVVKGETWAEFREALTAELARPDRVKFHTVMRDKQALEISGNTIEELPVEEP